MTHDPTYVQPRKPLTRKQRLEMFLAHKGLCCICKTLIKPSESWWDEHERALWLAREGEDLNAMENRGPAHVRCARVKTDQESRERAKGRRVAQKHLGAHRPKGPPMPGSKRSKYRKKMNGKVELR